MKKKILGMALLAMSFVAFNSNAQTACKNDKCATAECTSVQTCPNDKPCRKGAPCDSVCKPQCRHQSAFDSMNLSDRQKDQLKALEQKRRDNARQQAQARRQDKKRGNANARAARQEAKKQYLQELKGIIGPENYIIFLENFYVQDNGMRGVKPNTDRMARAHKGSKNDKCVRANGNERCPRQK